MAIALPTTAAVKTAAPRVAPAAPPFGANALSSTLPLTHLFMLGWLFLAGLTASLAAFGGNDARMLRHLVRPQLKPLVKTASPRPAL